MADRKILQLDKQRARRIWLRAQRLDETAPFGDGPQATRAAVEHLGYVQIDTINVVERAHHLTLFSRMHDYQPRLLNQLLEKRRTLWEHWTHDASAIPTQWFAHWKHRFERYRTRIRRHAWWKARLGDDPDRTIAAVRERIERDGPLQSRDFAHDRAKHRLPEDGWWGWKPAKAALEHLWRSGELAIVRRINFQKVYDLTQRVLPEHHARPASAHDEHVEWACVSALQRLGIASPAEIANFWNAIDLATARAWCNRGLQEKRVVEAVIAEGQGAASGKPRRAFALAEDESALRRLDRSCAKDGAPPADDQPMRLLSPFDPVLRDRQRTQRLFNFDYRFEAFVPAPKRRFGYYVMPLLQGERLVGRINPKFHRDRGALVIHGLWWEKRIKPTRARKTALDESLQRLAKFLGAERIESRRAK